MNKFINSDWISFYLKEYYLINQNNYSFKDNYNNLNLFKKLDVCPLYYNIELNNYFNDHLVVNNMPIESLASKNNKYTYSNKTQKIINNKKIILVNKNKIN